MLKEIFTMFVCVFVFLIVMLLFAAGMHSYVDHKCVAYGEYTGQDVKLIGTGCYNKSGARVL